MSAVPSARPVSSGPSETILSLAHALDCGQARAGAALFSRDACLLTPDGTGVQGRVSIHSVLVQLVAMRLRLEARVERIVPAGEVALAKGHWHGTFAGSGGESYEQHWRSSAVLRCLEGEWKLHILVPWEATAAAEASG